MTLKWIWCLHSILLLIIVHGKATQNDQYVYKEDFDNKICGYGAIFSYRNMGTLIQCLSVCTGDERCKGVVFRSNLCNGCTDFNNMNGEAGTRLYKKASCIDQLPGDNDKQHLTRCVKKILTVENGMPEGTWSNSTFCLQGTYAIGYRLTVNSKSAVIDNIAVSAVELICQETDESQHEARPTHSGQYGQLKEDNKTCSFQEKPRVLKAFQMQVEGTTYMNMGLFSIAVGGSGVNYIRFMCGPLEVNGQTETIEVRPGYGPEGTDGDWSNACDDGQGVCGLSKRVRMVSSIFSYDGLNDVALYCC